MCRRSHSSMPLEMIEKGLGNNMQCRMSKSNERFLIN
jgi:hypothetical protein